MASYFPAFTKEDIGDILVSLGMRPDARGEMLSTLQFAAVANEIAKRK